jgi:hypothetical protein
MKSLLRPVMFNVSHTIYRDEFKAYSRIPNTLLKSTSHLTNPLT